MYRSSIFTGLSAALLSVSLASAQQFPMPLRFVTADGTWDCKDKAGTQLGTVVVLGSAYGVIGMDNKVVGYGTLHRVGREEYDLPHYVIMDGYLKDELGFSGTTMRGPKADYENFSTGIFFVLVKADSAGTVTEAECIRRLVPGKLQ